VEIDDEVVASFWRDGVVCLRGAFRDWVEPLRACIEEALDGPGPLAAELGEPDLRPAGRRAADSYFVEQGVWNHHPGFERFARESPSVHIGHRLLGSRKVNLFFDQLFVKEPGSPEQRTPWHQDLPYWPIRGRQVLSVWVTVDPVSRETGALRYVRGSHEWAHVYRPYSFGKVTVPLKGLEGELMPDIDADPDGFDVVSWELEPGDCLVHHGMTVHGSPGNASAGVRRRAYSLRWTGDDVTWDPRPGVLERIPLMTSRPLTLRPGDPLDSDTFPRLIG
jgi:ectoine hydroxylase-related dioxygenase (phytanoyl-CoA dioxygenase family)